jgi:hypothetical protein
MCKCINNMIPLLQELSYNKRLKSIGLTSIDIKPDLHNIYYYINTDGSFIKLGKCIYNEVKKEGNWHDGWILFLTIKFENSKYDDIISKKQSGYNYVKLPVVNYDPTNRLHIHSQDK